MEAGRAWLRETLFILTSVFWLLTSQFVFASEPPRNAVHLPEWTKAKRLMSECYGGWDLSVTMNSGLEHRQDFNEYADSNVSSIAGEQTEYDDTETAGSTYHTDRWTDADYSRDRQRNSGYVGINLTIPLYSKKERLSRKENADKQVEHLAELYAEYEGQAAMLKTLGEERETLKRVMIDSGQEGITAYFELIKKMEQSRAGMVGAARKIIVILENCGYVERDEFTGTGQTLDKRDKTKAQGG